MSGILSTALFGLLITAVIAALWGFFSGGFKPRA